MDRDRSPARLSLRDAAVSDLTPRRVKDALHGVRSSLAGVQAEAELLDLDGANVTRLMHLLKAAFARLATGEEHARTLGHTAQPRRVVLLEDDETVGTALLRRLGRAGFESCLVLSVESAVAWTTTGALMIADLTALEAASAAQVANIRDAHPIVLTGASADEAERRAQIFAPAAVLAKPVNFDLLAASLAGHPASIPK